MDKAASSAKPVRLTCSLIAIGLCLWLAASFNHESNIPVSPEAPKGASEPDRRPAAVPQNDAEIEVTIIKEHDQLVSVLEELRKEQEQLRALIEREAEHDAVILPGAEIRPLIEPNPSRYPAGDYGNPGGETLPPKQLHLQPSNLPSSF